VSEHYRVTVRAEGPGPAAEIRLRTFLKGLLRRAGLRAVKVEEVMSNGQATSNPGEGQGRPQDRPGVEAPQAPAATIG
jgi:hypothetical protein